MPLLLGSDGRRPTHCPQCSTRVRGDVLWCLACYASLDAADPATEGPVRTRLGNPNPASQAAPAPDVEVLAARMIAELAASGNRPAWGARVPTTPTGRAVVMAGLLAVGCAVLLSAMGLVGLAL
jgi:hypothetical protein